MSPVEELRAAANKLRETTVVNPPGIAEPLAALLDAAVRTAQEHEVDPDYVGMPEFRLCWECDEEECEGLKTVDRALAVARVILGGAE